MSMSLKKLINKHFSFFNIQIAEVRNARFFKRLGKRSGRHRRLLLREILHSQKGFLITKHKTKILDIFNLTATLQHKNKTSPPSN